MGLLSFLTAGKKMEEIKMSLVGKHVFDSLKDDELKKEIKNHADYRFEEGMNFNLPPGKTLEGYGDRVLYLFCALAMAELGVDHGLKGFQWSYVRNPLMVRHYDEGLWETTRGLVRKKWGVEVDL